MQPLASSSGSKTRRFIPIAPALPNGLRDVLSQSSMSLPADARQRVDSLLNPCTCKSVWKCKCGQTTASGPSVPESPASESVGGLSTLTQAAAMCCASSPAATSVSRLAQSLPAKKSISRPRPRPESPHFPSSKRQKHDVTYSVPSQGPDLPPILYGQASPPSSSISTPMPEFTFMPPMSQITSLAGSGCTCGVECACPGCVEHRGLGHTSHDHRDCAEGCGTCIDRTLGIALPSTSSSQETSTSFLDRFFARAAALPPPPAHRKMSSIHLDPMNTTVYTNALTFPSWSAAVTPSRRGSDPNGNYTSSSSVTKLLCW
ncbi:unnamed protein product [Cyclocybe aegerita]|uniref:Uncharacterized protein n=1 Tax=Cyclocybe aegerita TaxID=1973307 RepID=A0A8S0X9K5_CYCAE|nr:unnamed protein product [Cyclocybe aegerita]